MSKRPIGWWEIQVPDVEKAAEFYTGVFGWKAEQFAAGYHVLKHRDGTMLGGLQQRDGDPAGRSVHVCIDVESDSLDGKTLEQILAEIERHGGKVTARRTEIAPEMGWYATFEDPTGLSLDLATDRPAE